MQGPTTAVQMAQEGWALSMSPSPVPMPPDNTATACLTVWRSPMVTDIPSATVVVVVDDDKEEEEGWALAWLMSSSWLISQRCRVFVRQWRSHSYDMT